MTEKGDEIILLYANITSKNIPTHRTTTYTEKDYAILVNGEEYKLAKGLRSSNSEYF